MIPGIGIGPLGPSEWTVPSVGLSGPVGTPGASAGAPSFGKALSNAIGSLENTQATANTDAMQLATGKLQDPTTAITAIENASMSMSFASEVRNALDTDATTLMQTTF